MDWERGAQINHPRIIELARARGDRYIEAWATISMARYLAESMPAESATPLAAAMAAATKSGNKYLRDAACVAQATAARSTGDLHRCLELAIGLLLRGASALIEDAVSEVGVAALLARDDAIRLVVEAVDRAQRSAPGLSLHADAARHALDLLEGKPSSVQLLVRNLKAHSTMTNGSLWWMCREAIDFGDPEIALASMRVLGRPGPHGEAVVASLEAAARVDEGRWQDALGLAYAQGLRLIAVDALEGLAVAAGLRGSSVECIRVLAAAQRLRDETGYRWRFSFEESAIRRATTAAHAALGDAAAEIAGQEGHDLNWKAAAEYARRAR